MAHLADRRYIVGGKPALILAGEVQYFRLHRSEWRDRIRQAKEGGLNAIASYIPWIFHEEIEGDIDVAGRKRPEHNISAFIDLCHEEGLWFIARPGPYVMAECKNEGLPYWVYSKYPDVVPETWGGKKVTGKNVDYMHPEFLAAAKRWYGGIMPVLASRLEQRGGNIIAVQLDNEIGMLMCWSQEAVLSELVQCDLTAWVQHKYGARAANDRYGFDLGDPIVRAKMLWSGDFPKALAFHADYCEFIRDRFAQYIAKLREFAEENGVLDVPFIVNIQGTGDGHARTYPIGVSQTIASFRQAPGYFPSSDQYLGELTRNNVCDEYLINAFTASVCRPEQPLSSIEFQAGTGDYGGSGSDRLTAAATDFKLRMAVIQGNRMVSHYTFAAGVNPRLESPHNDGNDRLGTGGTEHDPTSAPIGIGGKLDPIYFSTRNSNRTLLAVGDLLADMDEEHDQIHLGFIPDYYTDDVKHKGPMIDLASKFTDARNRIDAVMRPMMDASLGFTAVNLQEEIPAGVHCIAFSCVSCLHSEVQRRLVHFVEAGGHLLLVGRVPTEDLEGRPSSILADALGIQLGPEFSSAGIYLGIRGIGWADDGVEIATWQVQPLKLSRGEPFMATGQYGHICAATVPLGKGNAIVMAYDPPNHRHLWEGVFARLDVKPALTHDYPSGGLAIHRVRGRKEQRFVSLLNLDLLDKELTLREHGVPLFGGKLMLPGKKAKLLPIDVRVGGLHIQWSTAEITEVWENAVSFRQGIIPERARFAGHITPGKGVTVVEGNSDSTLVSFDPGQGSVLVHSA